MKNDTGLMVNTYGHIILISELIFFDAQEEKNKTKKTDEKRFI